MSSFAANHIQSLTARTSSTFTEGRLDQFSSGAQSADAGRLHALLLSLKSPLDRTAVRNTLTALGEYDQQHDFVNISESPDPEKNALKRLLVGRVLVGLYAQALDVCLQEAGEADAESEWWGDIERSRYSVAWYLIATAPQRLYRSFMTVVHELRTRNLPLRVSSFTPQALRQLFPQTMRPSALTASFFPHLAQQQHVLFTSPFELTRQECRIRREKLVRLRNARAEELGQLLYKKSLLDASISGLLDFDSATLELRRVIGDKDADHAPQSVIASLDALAFTQLPAHVSAHNETFASLCRPSRLTRMWPRLALLPPLSLILFRLVYGNRQSIAENANKVLETIQSFWANYVVEPVMGILDTVRSGGDEDARIVSKEGVKADMESLERMALSLSKDKLSYNQSQLDELAKQVRVGDLTPVLRVYEEDIKSPIRSAVTGTLVRTLLIQIQKAKVDLDQALSGIDKLLKSQELTFAFVGVAPALAILYAVWGFLRSSWVGGRGNSVLGGQRRRESTWSAMRRIERLLVSNGSDGAGAAEAEGPSHGIIGSGIGSGGGSESALPPLTSGLLLIAVARLRAYGEKRLPKRSLLRDGFLEDVADLESPALGRDAKLRVVERMWRTWGGVLGWHHVGRVKS